MLILKRTRLERPPLMSQEFDRAIEQNNKSRTRALEAIEKVQKTWLEQALTPSPKDKNLESQSR